MIEESEQVHRFACQELRGGNQFAVYSAELPGLAGWVSCHPLDPSPRGGDLYYLSACSQGIVARVVLADVAATGKLSAPRLPACAMRYACIWTSGTNRR